MWSAALLFVACAELISWIFSLSIHTNSSPPPHSDSGAFPSGGPSNHSNLSCFDTIVSNAVYFISHYFLPSLRGIRIESCDASRIRSAPSPTRPRGRCTFNGTNRSVTVLHCSSITEMPGSIQQLWSIFFYEGLSNAWRPWHRHRKWRLILCTKKEEKKSRLRRIPINLIQFGSVSHIWGYFFLTLWVKKGGIWILSSAVSPPRSLVHSLFVLEENHMGCCSSNLFILEMDCILQASSRSPSALQSLISSRCKCDSVPSL